MHAQAIGRLVWPLSSLVLLWPQVPARVNLRKGALLLALQSLNVCFQLPICAFRLFSSWNSYKDVKPPEKCLLIT